MTSQTTLTLTLQVEGGINTTSKELTTLTDSLLMDVRTSNVVDAHLPSTKGDPITTGQVALAVLPVALSGLITTVHNWLSRQHNQTIKVKIGEVEVEIPRNLPEAELERIVAHVKQLTDKN